MWETTDGQDEHTQVSLLMRLACMLVLPVGGPFKTADEQDEWRGGEPPGE